MGSQGPSAFSSTRCQTLLAQKHEEDIGGKYTLLPLSFCHLPMHFTHSHTYLLNTYSPSTYMLWLYGGWCRAGGTGGGTCLGAASPRHQIRPPAPATWMKGPYTHERPRSTSGLSPVRFTLHPNPLTLPRSWPYNLSLLFCSVNLSFLITTSSTQQTCSAIFCIVFFCPNSGYQPLSVLPSWFLPLPLIPDGSADPRNPTTSTPIIAMVTPLSPPYPLLRPPS